MTDAEHAMIIAACFRAAECWATGNIPAADLWFGAALTELGDGDFVDSDEEASR
jgi:hypothetical protein